MGIDAIVALIGLLAPPVVDFVKKKWLKSGKDSPEATMSALATTSPDTLPKYVEAMTAYMEAQTKYFNRDVVGAVSQMVVDLRAAIRPLGVIASLIILASMAIGSMWFNWAPSPAAADTVIGTRLTCEAIATSWFGDRISIGK